MASTMSTKAFTGRAARAAPAPRVARRGNAGVVKACGEGRLVGLPAPLFEAEGVFDQEFQTIKLDDYKCALFASLLCSIWCWSWPWIASG